jgi:hypothetical protein
VLEHRTQKGALVRRDDATAGVWVPLSQVELTEAGKPGRFTLTIPEWLAIDKGLADDAPSAGKRAETPPPPTPSERAATHETAVTSFIKGTLGVPPAAPVAMAAYRELRERCKQRASASNGSADAIVDAILDEAVRTLEAKWKSDMYGLALLRVSPLVSPKNTAP